MKKYLLLAFRGEMMCFVHVLLYAKEIREKGGEARIIIEGEATKIVPDLVEGSAPFAALFAEIRDSGQIDSICRACSAKMGVLDAVEKSGLPIRDEISGHPSITPLLEQGYNPVAF